MSVVRGVHEAAREIVPCTAGTVRLAIVAYAPTCGVLMESMVGDICWSGGRRESDG